MRCHKQTNLDRNLFFAFSLFTKEMRNAISIVNFFHIDYRILHIYLRNVRNMIVKSAPNSDFNRVCHTTRGRRANGIVNCFIAIVGSVFLDLVVLRIASSKSLYVKRSKENIN